MLAPVTKLSFDEAVYAVEAMNILQKGEMPVFFYNQPYTGALQAYISAFFYSIFGINEIWVKFVPFLFSLGFMITNFLLAKKIFASKWVGLIALALTAVTSPFWANWTTRAGSNYSEMMVLGNIVAILGLKILWEKRTAKLEAALFFCMGLASGLGFWIQPTIVYYLIPLAVLFLFKKPKALLQWQSYMFFAGLALGALPVIIWNLSQNGNTLRSVINKPDGIKQAWIDFFLLGVPVLLGVRGPSSTVDFFTPLAIIVYLVYFSSFAFLLVTRGRDFLKDKSVKKVDFLILFTFIVPLIWSFTPPFNLFVIEPRYVSPLYTSLPIIAAYFIFKVSQAKWGNSTKYFAGGLLLVLVTSNIYGYFKKPPESFLSQYKLDNLIGYLNESGYKYIYANFEYSYRLVFETKGEITAASYNSLAMEARYPEYTRLVKEAPKEKVAYVLSPTEAFNIDECEEDLSKQLLPCKKKIIDNQFAVYSWR